MKRFAGFIALFAALSTTAPMALAKSECPCGTSCPCGDDCDCPGCPH
jgi:hypothetical protein